MRHLVDKFADEYKLYSRDPQCFFCSRKAGYTHYVPALHVRSTGTQTDDMRRYRVCAKCLARCVKMAEVGHEELKAYVAKLEARGSVSGRVRTGPNVPLTVRKLKDLLVVRYDGTPVVIYDIEVVNGRFVVDCCKSEPVDEVWTDEELAEISGSGTSLMDVIGGEDA